MYAGDPEGVQSTGDLVQVYRSVLFCICGCFLGGTLGWRLVSVSYSLILRDDATRGRPQSGRPHLHLGT